MGRKRSGKSASGMGMGPLLIVLFLFVVSLLVIVGGQGLIQLGVRIGIVVGLVGLMYVVWYQLAI
jgi:hypothetical protein